MKGPLLFLASAALVVGLVMAGCAPAAPAPTPTKAPAAPTKAAEPTKPAAATAAPTKAPEPTKPAAAQPTAAPAKKVDWPQKGRTITVIVPITAGGGTDVVARLVSAALEKDLGTSVQVVNRPGGGQQVGMTELAQARPDGYTLAVFSPTTLVGSYLDPERKAAYTRKSFDPVALLVSDPIAFAVRKESPMKTLKDLVDTAKANPEKVKIASGMFQSTFHLMLVDLERLAGAKFAIVNFEGGGPGRTALLGGHVDASINTTSELVAQVKAGELRVLAVADRTESKYFPGVPTAEAQGHKLYYSTTMGMTAPAGTPKEILDLLNGALKKALESNELKSKMDDMALVPTYLNAAQFSTFLDETEAQVKPLLELAKVK